MAKYKVEMELEMPSGSIVRDTVEAKNEKHLEAIRQEARRDTPRGATHSIKVTKI